MLHAQKQVDAPYLKKKAYEDKAAGSGYIPTGDPGCGEEGIGTLEKMSDLGGRKCSLKLG